VLYRLVCELQQAFCFEDLVYYLPERVGSHCALRQSVSDSGEGVSVPASFYILLHAFLCRCHVGFSAI